MLTNDWRRSWISFGHFSGEPRILSRALIAPLLVLRNFTTRQAGADQLFGSSPSRAGSLIVSRSKCW
jgi:hypothetical protein